jgi:imidazole glycerol-phosphate synthase subunit HisH
MTPRVTIVDYGAGNLHSVTKAFVRLGAEVEIAETPELVESARCLILPGVGAFGEGMEGLRRRGLVEPLRRYASSGRPLTGICLGAQLLMEESEEFGRHEGLGIVPGQVRLLPHTGVKIPHVGWCRIHPAHEGAWKGSLLEETPPQTWSYFVHSYQCVPADPKYFCALADYGGQPVTAAVRRDAVVGLQFHPEKSGTSGLAILRTLLRSTSLS